MRVAERWTLLALVLVFGVASFASPSYAVEDGLFGVRIGASYRELVEKFGPPHGILFPSGGGLVFQTVAPAPSQAGLPDFSGAPTVSTDIPVWVLPVRASVVTGNQSQWLYDFRKGAGISLGILLNGEGADAVVTDVIVAGFPKYLKGKPQPVRTAKGVVLQNSFEDVLKKYGYPPLIEIYAPTTSGGTGAARGGAAGGGMRAGVGARGGAMRAGGGRGGGGRGGGGMRGGGGRGGGGRGGGRGMRGGRAQAPGSTMTASTSSYELVLTGARGGRRGGGGRGGRGGGGGMRSGGGRGGGGRGGGGMRGGGGRGGGGRGGLPPLGVTPTPSQAETLMRTAVVDRQSISFSRDCTMVYEGIAFALHDFKVYRIHVSE